MKKTGTRHTLKTEISRESELVSTAKANLSVEEQKVAKVEYAAILDTLATLTEKSRETFVASADVTKLTALTDETTTHAKTR